MPPWCESILGLKVEAVQGKQVSLEWTETSRGLWEWWHCLDFQAEDRLTPRWLVGQPCGKASWESLVAKPRGKDTNPLILHKGSMTLLLELGSKSNVHAPSRDED